VSAIGERRPVAPSIVASVAIHLGLLAVIGAVWVPSVQQAFERVIPVRLLSMAGDGSPASGAPRAEAPKPPPPRAAARPAARPRPSRETSTAERPAPRVPEMAAPAPDPGPQPVGSAASLSISSAPTTAPDAAVGDARGVAGALGALGRDDALGAGSGAAIGAPGYRLNPKPEYPSLARERGFEGTVLLRVRVLPDGTAGEVAVERSSGHEILDGAALRAVKLWLFSPATRNGIPVPAWVTVPVRFSLS
jgi:protein TonB